MAPAAAASAQQAPPADLQARLTRAQEALQAGRYDEAIPLLEVLARELPAETGIHLNLGMALTLSGHPGKAIAPLQRAVKGDPDLLPASLFLGLAYIESGAPDKAVAPLEKVISLDRDNRYAREALAQAFAMLEQPDRAVEQYEALRRAHPNDPQVLAATGRAYEDVARSAFAALQELDPDSPHVWLLVADVLTVQERYPQAFDLLRKAEAALPGFPGIHESVARVYAASGHDEWAAAERRKAEAAPPDCKTLPVACAYLEGKYADALSRTRGATSAAALYWRARAANDLASQTFAALDRLPPSVERHLVRADIYRGQGEALPAADELRKALALAPGDPRIERDLAGALFAARKTDEALPLLKKLLAATPGDAELAVGYGEMLVQTQQMDEAVPVLTRALESRPDLLPGHSALGRALLAKGDAAAAVAHLEKALPTDGDGSLHYQLAQAYQRTGQADRAKAMLAKYQELQQAAPAPPAEDGSAAPSTIRPPAP